MEKTLIGKGEGLDSLKKFISTLEEDEKEEVIEKSIPVKAAWRPLLNEFRGSQKKALEKADELKALCDEMKARKRLFWATVETDLGIFDRSMTVSDDNSEIEIYAEDKE